MALLCAHASKPVFTFASFPQPDGTTILVHLAGDKDFSWYQATDNALLVRVNNYFYIAQTNTDGTLTSTGVLAHNVDERTAEETALIAAQDASLFKKAANAQLNDRRKAIANYPKNFYTPHTGEVHIPIIMMEYTDTKFVKQGEELKAQFDEYFNSTTKTPLSENTRFTGYSSVAQFFRDASQGKFTPVFDLYGPYTADNNHDYYGKVHGYARELELLKEAVKKADDDIDFTQYDSNNDGRVDMVYILYAGTGANQSQDNNDFWPACWTTSGEFTNADGLKIGVIGGANELLVKDHATMGNVRAGIGVTCHEISHGLGLPDLYWTLDTDPKDPQGYVDYNNCGPEDWDLMDGGENFFNAVWPCQYTAWERDVMGWTDIEELTEPTTVTLFPLNKEGGKAYRVTNPANKNEYYIIENYQNDEWNKYISNRYGTGLMITHINLESDAGLSMKPNNTYGKPNVTILPADGYILALYSKGYEINYRGEIVKMPSASEYNEKDQLIFNVDYYIPECKGDPYPGLKNVTSLAAYKNYTGDEMVTTYPITDITKNSDGSMTFKFMGGSVPPACAAPTIRYNAGTITATSETANSVCHISTTLTSCDETGDDEVTPKYTLKISAYATAEGYGQSETSTLEVPYGASDVNGDGEVNISDVTTLVNKILNK